MLVSKAKLSRAPSKALGPLTTRLYASPKLPFSFPQYQPGHQTWKNETHEDISNWTGTTCELEADTRPVIGEGETYM